MLTPLQVVVVRDRGNPATGPYLTALRQAFEGGAAPDGSFYLGDSNDLQVRVLDPPIEGARRFDVQGLLRAAEHTLVVHLDPNRRIPPGKHVQDLRTRAAGTVLDVPLPPPRSSGPLQSRTHGKREVEDSLRPVAYALLALERGRRILETSVGQRTPRLRFFISHAKHDGLATGISLLELAYRIRELVPAQSLPTFYDAVDIPMRSNWREELEKAAKRSVLIALCTEEYTERLWCRREYLWAEECGVPIVVVDLRSRQTSSGSSLPLSTAPCVRVVDGNLLRILLHAIQSHYRLLRLQWALEQRKSATPCVALPRPPSLISLSGALQRLGGAKGVIVHPNPRLPDAYARAMATILAPSGTRLLSQDDWATT